MVSRNIIFIALLCILSGGVILHGICKTAKSCKDLDNRCVCYCSRKCGPREKEMDDKPVFVPNDPHGHYCYCKAWDRDQYKKRGCHLQ